MKIKISNVKRKSQTVENLDHFYFHRSQSLNIFKNLNFVKKLKNLKHKSKKHKFAL